MKSRCVKSSCVKPSSLKVASRLGVSLVTGAAVTFLILMLMSSLIASSNTQMAEGRWRKIGDIIQPERQVSENLREVKPAKPAAPAAPPPSGRADKERVEVPGNAISMAPPRVEKPGVHSGPGRFVSDSDYIPVYVPQPAFPARAQARGVSGYAVIEVIITTAGAVRDPKIVEEHPGGYGFGAAALAAAEKLKYNPRVVSGVAREVPGVLYKFSFVIEQY